MTVLRSEWAPGIEPALSSSVATPVYACAIVASGTSRFLVLGGHDLPTEECRRSVAANLIRGRGNSMGLGNEHYQANKVVFVDDPVPGQPLAFHYYQVSVHSSQVYSGMECSNAAPAAVIWAKLHTNTADENDHFVRTINVGTGQAVALEPPSKSTWWQGDWGVQFTAPAQHADTDAEPFSVRNGNQMVAGHIIRRGNVFVLAAIAPALLTPSSVVQLAGLGDNYQRRRGGTPSVTKVLAYEPLSLDEGTRITDAVCYSSGQRHHSLPGSAAMALGAFMTNRGYATIVTTGPDRGSSLVRLNHPSGEMTVRVDLRKSETAGTWRVEATSFSTPVRLLLSGTAVA